MSLKNFLELNNLRLLKLNDKEKIKFLRYIRKDYNYDLRKPIAPQTKAKIKRDIDDYLQYANVSGASIVRSTKHLKTVLNYTGQNNKYKVGIVPLLKGEKLRVKNKQVIITSKSSDRRHVIFDKNNMLVDPKKEVERVLKNKKYDAAQIIAGNSYIGGFATPQEYNKNENMNALKNMVNKLALAYENHGEWLRGLALVDFKNQKPVNKKSIKEFNAKRSKNAKKNKKIRGGGL